MADQHLAARLARLPRDKRGKVQVVGHCHIDVAWLWRLRHSRYKAARSFTTALRLMEEYPELVFLQSQPQLYAFIKEDQPLVYERIRQRVVEGRWEPEGGMWVEADTNLPSGESLVRQLLFGIRFFEQEFGRRSTVLWLPNAFGYSAALPQILKKAGINTFITTKLSWNQYNRMPHDTFWWRGIDGSEVLAHFLTTPGPHEWDQRENWAATYNGQLIAGTVLGTWWRYQDRHINGDLLIAFGHGDGGGGPDRDMCEMRRRLDQLPGLPSVQPGTVGSYAQHLHGIVAAAPVVPTWDGELYLEYHRGTFTSQGRSKAMNRRLELALRDAEWLASWAFYTDPSAWLAVHKQLNEAWTIVLRNQFHDILPGSSIGEVYGDQEKEYEEAETIINGVRANALKVLVVQGDRTWTILNSAASPRTAVVRAPRVAAGGRWETLAGEVLPYQQDDATAWVRVGPVAGLGTETVVWRPGSAVPVEPGPFDWHASERRLVTPYYEATWNGHGQLVRLYDRRCAREAFHRERWQTAGKSLKINRCGLMPGILTYSTKKSGMLSINYVPWSSSPVVRCSRPYGFDGSILAW
ncbi:MAG: hypothetical protein OWU33_01150 [Firmicutes bacterium]|nr:hypothetical protein [Bacillota bacterium]